MIKLSQLNWDKFELLAVRLSMVKNNIALTIMTKLLNIKNIVYNVFSHKDKPKDLWPLIFERLKSNDMEYHSVELKNAKRFTKFTN